jgi:hypothetical protein
MWLYRQMFSYQHKLQSFHLWKQLVLPGATVLSLKTGKYNKLLFDREISFDFIKEVLFVNASKIGVCKMLKS